MSKRITLEFSDRAYAKLRSKAVVRSTGTATSQLTGMDRLAAVIVRAISMGEEVFEIELRHLQGVEDRE